MSFYVLSASSARVLSICNQCITIFLLTSLFIVFTLLHSNYHFSISDKDEARSLSSYDGSEGEVQPNNHLNHHAPSNIDYQEVRYFFIQVKHLDSQIKLG